MIDWKLNKKKKEVLQQTALEKSARCLVIAVSRWLKG